MHRDNEPGMNQILKAVQEDIPQQESGRSGSPAECRLHQPISINTRM